MVTIEQAGRAAAKRKALRNPQAFPTHPDGALIHDGMTLRDYFAAKAMQAILLDHRNESGSFDIDARCAYMVADALLKARSE